MVILSLQSLFSTSITDAECQLFTQPAAVVSAAMKDKKTGILRVLLAFGWNADFQIG